jgi:predicted nucleic acid-binding protein
MNILDSSAWLEYFLGEENADFFDPIVADSQNLLILPLNIYEVSKILRKKLSKESVEQLILSMENLSVAEIPLHTYYEAAEISQQKKLGMADSIILATANYYNATLWTQDVDFKGIEGVKYIQKK